MRAKAFLLFDVSAHWGVEYRGGRANRLAMSFLRLNEPPGGHPLLVPLQDVQRANICPASGRAPCECVPTGAETVPLPVLTDPRTRLVEGLLGVTAAGLYAVSIPLAIVLLAGQRRSTIDDLLRAEGVSLIVTLWIFLGIALAATAIFAAILVLRRKAEAGAGWVSFGVIAIVLTIMFVLFGSMNGAWVGVVASGLILGAGLMDTVLAIQKKRASESARLRS